MNKWIFTSILLVPLLIIQPAFASIVIFDQSDLIIQQGEDKNLSFSILGEKKEITIGKLDDMPDGLEISILKDELSNISGVIQVSAKTSTSPGETMIRFHHGDEVYFLSVIVLPKESGFNFYLIVAMMVIFLVALVAARSRLPSRKVIRSFRKTPFVIFFLMIMSTMIISPAFGVQSTINVNVMDENGTRIEGATVVLFDSNYEFISSEETDPDGVSRFTNLEHGNYICEVYFQESNLQGEFWGSGTIIVEQDQVDLEFLRTTPKIINVESSGIDEENKISIVASIMNPGPNEVDVVVNLIIDRDQSRPFDVVRESNSITIASGSVETYEFASDLIESGAYDSSIYLSLTDSIETITDQTPWTNAADIYGSVSIKAKDAQKKAQTSFFLFDTSYSLLDHKTSKGSKKVQWDNLFPMNYVIETYHRPFTSLDLIEFWGGFTTQVSENIINFKQMSPSIKDVKINKDSDLFSVSVKVRNQEGYSKQVRVSLIIDSDRELPFDGFQESEILILNSDEEIDFVFSINRDIFSKGKIYVLVQSEYNNNYIITDQLEWIKLK